MSPIRVVYRRNLYDRRYDRYDNSDQIGLLLKSLGRQIPLQN